MIETVGSRISYTYGKNQIQKQNSTKSKTKELNKPKSIKNSKKLLSSVINYNKLKLYYIKTDYKSNNVLINHFFKVILNQIVIYKIKYN